MEVIFLGTGTSQGIPVIGSTHPVCLSDDPRDKRLRVSVLVSWDDYRYVIDCGPDFREQMLSNKVSKIDGIVFTHEHADSPRGMPRSVYNENKYPGAPSVIENELVNQPFLLGNLKVVPINTLHNRLQVFGFRFKDFAYLTDVKTVEEKERSKLMGVKVLVVNALRVEPHHSHFNLEEALQFIKEIQPEKAYLTHISHLLGFHEEVEKTLPKNVFIAYDNLKITI